MSTTFTKEMRLRCQIDLLDDQVEEALAIEDANIQVLESKEQSSTNKTLLLNNPLSSPSLALTTQSAQDSLPNDFQDTSFPITKSALEVLG